MFVVQAHDAPEVRFAPLDAATASLSELPVMCYAMPPVQSQAALCLCVSIPRRACDDEVNGEPCTVLEPNMYARTQSDRNQGLIAVCRRAAALTLGRKRSGHGAGRRGADVPRLPSSRPAAALLALTRPEPSRGPVCPCQAEPCGWGMAAALCPTRRPQGRAGLPID